MVRPGAELIILAFALFQIGAIPIVIDPGMGLKNFRACVLRSKPRALVGGILPAVALSWYFAKEFQFLQTRILIGGLFLKHCKNYKVGQLEPAHANPFDLAAILFTSGSTGPPKGVCYEHRHFDAQPASSMTITEYNMERSTCHYFPCLHFLTLHLEWQQ